MTLRDNQTKNTLARDKHIGKYKRVAAKDYHPDCRADLIQIVALQLAVQEMFALDPFCGAAFVFRSKRADRIKLLMWDQTGMVLAHKRLEGGKFVWPQVQDGVMRISSAQLAALFEGLDWRLVRPERARRPRVAG